VTDWFGLLMVLMEVSLLASATVYPLLLFLLFLDILVKNMITLFYLWVIIGLGIGAFMILTADMNDIFKKPEEYSQTTYRVMLGLVAFIILAICYVLGPLPLLLIRSPYR